ncbi:MAG TPA: MEDS domain-containing protein [Acidimicrobiales bacterium]|nr:MEDS domain-containing protein [Acidimicrobiales bacterium]
MSHREHLIKPRSARFGVERLGYLREESLHPLVPSWEGCRDLDGAWSQVRPEEVIVSHERYTHAPSDHVCRLVHSREEQAPRAAAWVRQGLRGAERTVYVGRENDSGDLLRALDADGVDWRQATRNGQLLLVRPEDMGQEDADDRLHRRLPELKALLDESLDQGYAGLRVADDVSAALTVESEQQSVLDYEERLDELCTTSPLSALCFYERRRSGVELGRWAQAHQCLADDVVQAKAEPGRLTLSGEMDFSNVALVTSVLAKATAPAGDVVVDMRDMSFIDVRGVEELVELARQVAPVGRVKVISPPVAMRRILEIAGWEAELDLVEDLEREAT